MKGGDVRKPTTKQAKAAELLDRGNRVFAMRISGMTLREIAHVVGVSHEQVRKDIQAIVKAKTNDQNEMVAEARAIAEERLEEIIRELRPLLIKPINSKTPERVIRQKLDAAVQIRRATKDYAELFGAKLPQKLELSGSLGIDWSAIAKEARESINPEKDDR